LEIFCQKNFNKNFLKKFFLEIFREKMPY